MQKTIVKTLSVMCALFFLLSWQSVYAQQKGISGTVTDSKGETLIGVSVSVKGSTVGTVTDLDGKYTLSVPNTAKTLVVRYVGMKDQDVPITGSVVDIVMTDNFSELDEVVVIGFGTVKKRDLTGSVSSVQGETLAKIPVPSTAEAITGRLAGVQVTRADGSPDAEVVIRVRGGGSVTGDNSPLYIVDGFPVSSINNIPPNDIQSLDVLKDAASTAIYGSQGANGVVIITTKSAQGGKTQISYNGFLQIKKLSKRMSVLDPYEYVMWNYELAALTGEDELKSFAKKFGVYEDLELYKYQKGLDWQEDMFGSDVVSFQQNLSITGGSEKTKYSLSATWDKNGGLMANNDYGRYNVSFKLNHDISKRLKFTANARVIDTEINGSGTSGGTYKIRTSQAVTSPATKGLTDMIIVDPSTLTDEEYDEWVRSNLSLSEQAAQYWQRRNERVFNFIGSLDWNIIDDLTYRIEGGYEYNFNETKKYWGENTNQASYVGGLPLVDWTKQNRAKMRFSHTLSWRKQLNTDHTFNFMAGQEVISDRRDNNYMYATGFGKDLAPEKIFANMGLGTGITNITSYVAPHENLASFFGRILYNYKERYLINMTLRSDGSSKFAPGKQWSVFPAASMAWRILEEPFMENAKTHFSNLKLRFSYGEVGNNRILSSLYKLDYAIQATKTYGLGDKQSNYYSSTNTQLANPNIRWETTVTRNLGLDFGLFGERLNGTVEGYWNTAKDLLIERNTIAPGYKTTVENVGQTSNKGIEVVLNGLIINKKDFNLSVNFNIGVNKSNVDNLADGLTMQEYSSGWAGTDLKGYNDYRIMVGKPVGLIYGFVTDGYYTTNDFESYDASGKKYILKEGVPTTGLLGGRAGIRPGTIKLKDLDGDEVVDESDRQIIGDTNPDFIGGFGVNSTWKGFDFTALFNFVYGNDVYNANKIASSQQYRTTYTNMLGFMNGDNRYTYLNIQSGEIVTDLATLAQMNEGANAKEYWTPASFGNAVVLPHSWAVEDGSFLRLQNITLGYTFPRKLTQKFLCDQLRLYVTLNNVWVWTKYSGYDPEVYSPVRGSSTSGLTPGVDYSSYPKSFSYTFGLNLTF